MLKAYWIHFRFLLSDWLSIGGDMIYMYYTVAARPFFWTSLAKWPSACSVQSIYTETEK